MDETGTCKYHILQGRRIENIEMERMDSRTLFLPVARI